MGLARNSIGTLLSQCFSLGVQSLIGVLIARWLGAEGKGMLYLLVVSINMIASLTSVGLGPAAIYFIGKDRQCLPAVLTNSLIVMAILSGVVIGLCWFFLRTFQPQLYTQFPVWLWLLSAFLLPVHLLESLLMQVASALLRIQAINLIMGLRNVLYLAALIGLVIYATTGVNGGFLAYALSVVLSTVSFALVVWNEGGRLGAPHWELLTASLRFGGKAYLSNLLRLLNLRLDALIVASLASGGIAATGVYSVATNLAELVLYIPSSIRLSLFPLVVSSSEHDANRLTATACRHTAFLTWLLMLGAFCGGPPLIRALYGPEFVGAVTPLWVLLPGAWMLAQSILFYSDLDGRGKPEVSAMSRTVALILTVILDIILIPRYGIVGAAWASTCAYAVEFLVAGVLLTRGTGLTWSDILFIRPADLRSYLFVLQARPFLVSR